MRNAKEAKQAAESAVALFKKPTTKGEPCMKKHALIYFGGACRCTKCLHWAHPDGSYTRTESGRGR